MRAMPRLPELKPAVWKAVTRLPSLSKPGSGRRRSSGPRRPRRLVDEEVVADVAPVEGDRVVLVDPRTVAAGSGSAFGVSVWWTVIDCNG